MSGPQAERHKDLLHFIRAEMEAKGIGPSVDEMRGFMGLASKSGIERMLRNLEARCLITRVPHRARAIYLVAAKDYHRPDCDCDGCAETRYFEQLKLVKALQVAPEASLIPKLRGLKPLSTYTKGYWLLGFPARTERSAAQ